MNDKLKQFYDAISQNPNIKGIPASYEEFATAMSDSGVSSSFYNAISSNPNVKGLPSSYNDFADGLGLKKKEPSQQAGGFGATPSPLRSSADDGSFGGTLSQVGQKAQGMQRKPVLPLRPIEDRIQEEAAKIGSFNEVLSQKKSQLAEIQARMGLTPTQEQAQTYNKIAGEFNSELVKANEEQKKYNNLIDEYSSQSNSPTFAGNFQELMKDVKPYEQPIPVPQEIATWENIWNFLANGNDLFLKSVGTFAVRTDAALGSLVERSLYGNDLGIVDEKVRAADLALSKYYPANRATKSFEEMTMLEAGTAQFAQSLPVMVAAMATGRGGYYLAAKAGMRIFGSIFPYIYGHEQGMKEAEAAGITGLDKYNFAALRGGFEAISELILPDANLIKPITNKLFKDIIRQGAKGISKTDFARYAADFAAKGALEFSEEVFVELTSMLTDYAYGSALGIEELSPEMMSAREYGIMAISTMMGGGLFSTVGSIKDARSAKNAAIVAASDNVGLARQTAIDLMGEGVLTEVQAADFIATVEAVAAVRGRIPSMVGADAIVDTAPLIEQKTAIDAQIADLEIQKAQADDAYQPMLQQQIDALKGQREQLNEQIQAVITPPAQQQVTEAGEVASPVAEQAEAVVEGVQEGGVDTRIANSPLAEVVNKRGVITDANGNLVEGDVYVDGERVVLEAGGKIYDTLGSIDELSQMTAEQLPVQVVAPRITATEGGFTYNSDAGVMPQGTRITPQGKGLKAVKRDKNGNVKSVVVKDDAGNTFNLKGEDAQAMAFELMMDEISKGNLDAKIVLNDEAATAINTAGRPATAQTADSGATQADATRQGAATPTTATERGDGGRGSRVEATQETEAKPKAKPDAAKEPSTEGVDARKQAEDGEGVGKEDSKRKEAAQESEVAAAEKQKRKEAREQKKKDLEERKSKAKEKSADAIAKIKEIINKPLGVAFNYEQQLKEDKAFFGAIKDIITANIDLGAANFNQIVSDISNAIGKPLSTSARAATKALFNKELLKAYRNTYNALSAVQKKKMDAARDGVRKSMISEIKDMINPRKWEQKAEKIGKAKIDKEARGMLSQIAKSLDGVDLSSFDDASLQDLNNALSDVFESGKANQKDLLGLMKEAERIKGAQFTEMIGEKKKTIKQNASFDEAVGVLKADGVVRIGGRYYTKADLDAFTDLFEEIETGFTVMPRATTMQQARAEGKGKGRFALYNTFDFKTLLYKIAGTEKSLTWLTENVYKPTVDALYNQERDKRRLTKAINDKKKGIFKSVSKSNKELQEVAGFQPTGYDGRSVSKNTTNNQLIQLFNSIRQPDEFEKTLNTMPLKQVQGAVDYIMNNPNLQAYADALVDLYKVYKPEINAALEANGYASERLEDKPYPSKEKFAKKYGQEQADAYFELLDKVYDGNIPETVPYTPLSTQSLDPERAVPYDIMNAGNKSEQISIISNNLLMRKPSAKLELADPDSLFSNYVTSMTNMVNKMPLLGNFNAIFSKENMRELTAQYGVSFANNMKEQVNDVLLGRSGKQLSNTSHAAFYRWLNRSQSVIMFGNTRSAIFQLVSIPNFAIDAMEQGMFNEYAKAAMGGLGKDFRSAFKELSSQDWVRERFEQSASSIELQELKDPDGGGYQRFLYKVLSGGYFLTQAADVFAITYGGTPYYMAHRNQTYKDNMALGMDSDTAMKAAIESASKATFKVSQESQQSSLEYQKSAEQKNPIARLFLAFGTTNQQYMRKIRQAAMDIGNGRGSLQKNLFTIAYYGGIQNILFNVAAKGISLLVGSGDDDDESVKAKATMWTVMNQSLNGLLRGFGVLGGVVAATKDALYDLAISSEGLPDEIYDLITVDGAQPKPKRSDPAIFDVINSATPPIGIKMRQFKSAYDKIAKAEEPSDYVRASTSAVQAVTNIPTDRLMSIYDQFSDAVVEDLSVLERILRITNVLNRYTMDNILDERYVRENAINAEGN